VKEGADPRRQPQHKAAWLKLGKQLNAPRAKIAVVNKEAYFMEVISI
jgi:hypothetical protein